MIFVKFILALNFCVRSETQHSFSLWVMSRKLEHIYMRPENNVYPCLSATEIAIDLTAEQKGQKGSWTIWQPLQEPSVKHSQ